jgi:hypothetical protein
MNNIHPASINPKINKNRYMNIIKQKYRGIDIQKTSKIIGGANNSNIINNNIENNAEDDEKISNYLYMGGLTAMFSQLGTILYWFLIS